jgi:iron complex outermembrane receptor protein
VRYKRLFAQAFVNASNAGNSDSLDLNGTFILRTGQPIVDKSRVFAGQVQHAADFAGDRERLVYGVDYIRTDPRTFGTTNGRNEVGDNTTEYGAYVQSTTRLNRRVDLIGALRADRHDQLVGTFLSPRVALQFKPTETHNVRFAFNRAFQTPANFNFFLDLDQARSISGLPYNIRALGVPSDGFQFRRDCAAGAGGLCMRSPFTPAGAGGPGAFVPANAAGYYQAALNVAVAGGLQTQLAANPALGAAGAAAIVNALRVANPASVGTTLRLLNTTTQQFVEVQPSSVVDLPRLRPTFVNNYEVGYKGIFADRLRIAVDGWHQQRNQLLTAAVNVTPNVFLNPVQAGQLVGATIAPIVGAANAPTVAAPIAAALARVPVGTVVPNNPLTERGNIFFSYRNIDQTIRLYGSDMAVDFLATSRFTIAGTYSWLSKVQFDEVAIGTAPFSVNSPKHKASLTGRVEGLLSGLGFDVRGRYTDAFPVNSGVFVGNVPVVLMADAGVSIRRPVGGNRVLWSVNATNVLDNRRANFVGTPQIGRMVMTRVQYEF